MGNGSLTAIVTGAGSGIGRSTALLLDAAGYKLALVGRTESKLKQTADQLTRPSLVIPCDLCDPGDCADVIRKAQQWFNRIDVLANVAGDAPNLTLDKVTPAIWRRCIDTNLSAAVHLTAAAWPLFKQQQSGMIVNVSSMASISPFPGFAIYAAAKAGLNMFTLATAKEGKPLGIQAVAVAPGAVETPMLRSVFDEGKIPRHKALPPEAIAQVIVGCATGQRAFTSGETITVPSP